MNELHQIYWYSRTDKGEFLRRVIPLTLADAAIGTVRERARHALYWESEREELRPLLSRGIFGPTDYTAWVRINRWVADVSEMLAHMNDKLHPHGFDAIVADDFIRVREALLSVVSVSHFARFQSRSQERPSGCYRIEWLIGRSSETVDRYGDVAPRAGLEPATLRLTG